MSAPLRNVVLVGSTGTVGTPILAALKACATLSLTVVTRPRPATSTTTTLSATPGVRIIVADYTSVEELTVAFNGADAVISAVNTMLVDQTPFIDAAVAAKVRRFIPSEFGADLSHPRTAGLPVFTAKARAREKLQVLADQGVIEWAAVANGMFLDWGIGLNWLAPAALGPAPAAGTRPAAWTVYGDPARPFTATLLSDVARAVVGILQHPAETRNRLVYVQSMAASQLDYVASHGRALRRDFDIRTMPPEELRRQADAAYARKDFRTGAVMYIKVALYSGEEYSSVEYLQGKDNELFGVRRLDVSELDRLVAEYVKVPEAK